MLKSDAILLKKILEANHPSLYWYTPKDSIDYYFNNAINSMDDSLTELQFKNKIAWAVSKIRCGHTSVRSSKSYIKYFSRNKEIQFPLFLKAWNDSLVVLGSLFRKDSIFKRGTIITSINGVNNHELLDSMYQFISTDGYADNFKSQVISFNFPSAYKNAFGISDEYNITYFDTSGNVQSTIIKNYNPETDTLTKRDSAALNIIAFPPPSKREIRRSIRLSRRSLNIDTAKSIAYLRVSTFSGSGMRKFFKESFEKIKDEKLKNLVIDLRDNGGGSIGLSTNFLKYLETKSFRVADTVAAINRSFPYGKHIRLSLVYRAAMRFTSHKRRDGKFHFTNLEKHSYRHENDLHFNGNVYIVQGSFTFSAAAMFSSHLKGQTNVTIVGEETGGGYYGNSAVHLPSIILPQTRIGIVLPIYRVVNDSARIKTGHGIPPDIYVGPSAAAIKNGIDLKMQKVRELISDKKNNN